MKSIYCILVEQISIPHAAVVSISKKYTPTTDGAIALLIPVHDPIVPDIALPLIVPLVVEMCPDEVFVPLVEMFPTAVIVPFVVMLPAADIPNC